MEEFPNLAAELNSSGSSITTEESNELKKPA
jgi:hypothetical protein